MKSPFFCKSLAVVVGAVILLATSTDAGIAKANDVRPVAQSAATTSEHAAVRPEAKARRVTKTVEMAQATPPVAGLPPGGEWKREARAGGETWTYNFTVADAPKRPQPKHADAMPFGVMVRQQGSVQQPMMTPRGDGGGTTMRRDGAMPHDGMSGVMEGAGGMVQHTQRPMAQMNTSQMNMGGGGMSHPRMDMEPPDGAMPMQPRFARPGDPKTPAIGGESWYEVRMDAMQKMPPQMTSRMTMQHDGWAQMMLNDDELCDLRAQGVPYRKMRNMPLAGEPAMHRGMGSAKTMKPFAARLLSAAELQAGLSAFEIPLPETATETAAAKVHLKFTHPNLDQLVVWLAAGDRQVVLWDGRGGSDDAGFGDDGVVDSTVVLDRIFTTELSGAAVRGNWTLYASDSSAQPGVLEEAWIEGTTAPMGTATTSVTNPLATGDLFAEEAYFLSTAGGSTVVSNPLVGQMVYPALDFGATGFQFAVSVSAKATLDGTTYCTSLLTNVSNNLWYTWCATGWVVTSGTHTLRWDLDYNNAIDEVNETNNWASMTFTTGSAVDIIAKFAYMRSASNSGGTLVSPPTNGQSVYFHLDWQVNGSGQPLNVDHRAIIDGTTFCSFNLATNPGTPMTSWCNAPWTATPGAHTLKWDLDYNNTIAETNESNNSATSTFSVVGPDFEATSVYLRASVGGNMVDTPTVGQTVYLYFDWKSTSPSGLITVSTRAVVDGTSFCSGSLPVTTGSVTSWCSNPWTVTAGSHTLRWDLDYLNAIAETNEGNNSASKTFTPIGTVDLVATTAYLRTAPQGGGSVVTQPTVGQLVYFHFDWSMTGGGSAVTVTTRAMLDGTQFCSSSTSVSPPSSWTTACGTGWTVTSGSHTLRWDLDYNNTVSESSETNNSATATFTAGGSGGNIDIVAGRSYLIDAAGNPVTTPIAGQTVYFAVEATVSGSTTPVNLNVKVTLDGYTWAAGAGNAVSPGMTSTVYCIYPYYPAPGSHSVQWTLNYDNALAETNSGNNASSFTFLPVSGPVDVEAQRAFLVDSNGDEVTAPVVGQTVYFFMDSVVRGATTQVSFSKRAMLDGSQYCTFASNLTAGGYYSHCGTGWAVTAGTHTLRWEIDYDNVLSETNESNNVAITHFGSTTPQSGWWWDPRLNGTGFFIEYGGVSNNGLFVGAFVYDSSGKATWLVATGQMAGNLFSSDWLQVKGGQTMTGPYQAPWSQLPVGHVSIVFTDATHAVMTRSDGSSISIQRFGFTASPTIDLPTEGAAQSGWWWAGSDRGGTGYGIEIQGAAVFIVAYVYDSAGNPQWYLATGNLATATLFTGSWHLYSNGPQINSPESSSWGATDLGNAYNMTLSFSDSTHGMLTVGTTQIPITRFLQY